MDTPLLLACKSGQKVIIDLLLSMEVNADCADREGNTPLHFAAQNGLTNEMELLLNRGVNLDCVGSNGNTPLHLAVQYGRTNAIELLLNRGVNLDRVNSRGNTPLHIVARKFEEFNAIHHAELLVSKGANKSLRNRAGDTAYSIIPRKTLQPEWNRTLDYWSEPTNEQRQEMKEWDELRWKRRDMRKILRHPLHSACRSGDAHTLRILLEKGENVNYVDESSMNTLLHIACKRGYNTEATDIVKLLLDSGVGRSLKNEHGQTAFDIAKEKGYKEITKLF